MSAGYDLVAIAYQHLGENYYWRYDNNGSPVLMTNTALANPSYSGPWDAAEFVTYCIYRTYGVKYGLVDSTENTPSQESSAASWLNDATTLTSQFTEIASIADALNIPGAIIIGRTGDDVAISLGDGAHVIHAHADWNPATNTYYSDLPADGDSVSRGASLGSADGVAVDASLYDTSVMDRPAGVDIGDVTISVLPIADFANYRAFTLNAVTYSVGGGDNGNTLSAASVKTLPYQSGNSSVGYGIDTDDVIKFVAPDSGVVTADLSGLRGDLNLRAYNSAQTEIAASSAAGTAGESLQFHAVKGQTYYVHVDPHLTAASTYRLTVTLSSSRATLGDNNDFNGDGKADILWQNDDGRAAAWLLNGTALVHSAVVGPNPGPSWHIKGTGDFDQNDRSDIVWQHNDGHVAIWFLNSINLVGDGVIANNPGPTWHIIDTGHFNADGKSDLLWQNDDGRVAVWTLDGTTQLGGAVVGENPGPAWHIKAAGDFNGDGKSDILWQNDDGRAAVWILDGMDFVRGAVISDNPGTSWHIKDSGDFNGDGKSDILWQNDDGRAAIWFLDGLSFLAGSVVGTNPGPAWQAESAADYNGDGKSDILWQHDDGQAGMWLMGGFGVLDSSLIGPNVGPTWHVDWI